MREDFFATLESSGCLNEPQIKNNSNFEIDSKASFSTFVPKIEAVLGEQSLLKNGTWAFLGDGRAEKKSERYLFWTSLDINAKGKEIAADTEIPILIQTGDRKYYVSKSKVASRNGKYMAIADHLAPADYQNIIKAGEEYNNLSDAYAAYQDALNSEVYKDLPK